MGSMKFEEKNPPPPTKKNNLTFVHVLCLVLTVPDTYKKAIGSPCSCTHAESLKATDVQTVSGEHFGPKLAHFFVGFVHLSRITQL